MYLVPTAKILQTYVMVVPFLQVCDAGGDGHCGPLCVAAFFKLLQLLYSQRTITSTIPWLCKEMSEFPVTVQDLREVVASAQNLDITNARNSSAYWEDTDWITVARIFNIHIMIFDFGFRENSENTWPSFFPAGGLQEHERLEDDAQPHNFNLPVLYILNTAHTAAHPYAHYQILLESSLAGFAQQAGLKLDESHQMFVQQITQQCKARFLDLTSSAQLIIDVNDLVLCQEKVISF